MLETPLPISYGLPQSILFHADKKEPVQRKKPTIMVSNQYL